MSGEAEHRTKVLRVATRCTSIDQFVEGFARYCEKRTLFIASMTTRSPGHQSPFLILLADGSQALRGTCEVVEAWPTPTGPFRRPGVRIKLLQLDAPSEAVLTRLHTYKPPASPAPKPPVLPPLPPLKVPQRGTPAPGTPVAAASAATPGPATVTVPAAVPTSLPPLSRATVRVGAVAPPPSTVLPPLAPPAMIPPLATPPVGTATVTPRVETPPPVPPPGPAANAQPAPAQDPDDDAVTDVQGSVEAIRMIRDAAPTDPPPFGEPPPGAVAEERAPGSPIILPANPLAEITDDSLRGFVECTLYEETGKFSFDDLLERAGTDSDDDDPIAEPPPPPDLRASLPPELKPNPRRDATPPPARAAATTGAEAASGDGHGEILEVKAPAPSMARTMLGHAPMATAGAPGVLGPIPGGSDAPTPAPPPPPLPQPAPPPVMFGDLAMPPVAAGAEPLSPGIDMHVPAMAPPFYATGTSADDDLPIRRRTPLYAGLGAAAVILAIVVVVLLVRSSGSGNDAKAEIKQPAAKAAAIDAGVLATIEGGDGTGTGTGTDGANDGSGTGTGTDGADDGSGTGANGAGNAGAVPDPDDDPAELTAADRLPPPVGDCSASITTTPSGALVRANGRYYGETPLDAALPCGQVALQISYRRYATVEKTMTFAADKPAQIRLALERPRHKLRIVSTPGGATVSVNGAKVGTTPLYATVPGFSMLSIELRRAGFKTLRLKHYSKRTGGVVAGRLEKGR